METTELRPRGLLRLAASLPRGGFRIVKRLAAHDVMVPTDVGDVCCDLRESVCYPLLKYGSYPHMSAETKVLRESVGPKDLVLDIGANIGYMAKLFLRSGAKVIAFEPSPKAFRLLTKTLAGEGEARNIALSDQPGEVRFSECGMLDRSHIAPDGGVVVQAVTVDSLGERPTFIKIDVENHEPAVLRGAMETLSQYTPSVFFEAWNDQVAAECMQTIKRANRNYTFRRVGDCNYLAALAR